MLKLHAAAFAEAVALIGKVSAVGHVPELKGRLDKNINKNNRDQMIRLVTGLTKVLRSLSTPVTQVACERLLTALTNCEVYAYDELVLAHRDIRVET